jgi:hypothetical protein
MTRASAACRRLMTIPAVGQLTALAFVAAIDDPSRIRRSRDVGLSGLGPNAASVGRGRLRRQHLEVRRQARANPAVRGRQCHADALQGPAQTQGLGLRNRQKVNDAQGEGRSLPPPRNHHACDAAGWDGVRVRLSPASHETGGRLQLPRGAMPEGGSRRRRRFCSRAQPLADCDFNRAALHPAYPIKCRTSTQRTQAPKSVDTRRASALDPLENVNRTFATSAEAGAWLGRRLLTTERPPQFHRNERRNVTECDPHHSAFGGNVPIAQSSRVAVGFAECSAVTNNRIKGGMT